MRSFALATLTLSNLLACVESSSEPSQPRPIYWTRVWSDDGGQKRALPGVVKADTQATLSFEVGGRIASLKLDVGDSFMRGETLAALDRSSYALRLQQRRADLRHAEALLVEARDDFERHKALIAQGAVTQAAFDRAKAEYDSSAAEKELALASLDLARDALGDTLLRAPYSGTVTKRFAEPSQQTAAGEPVLEIQSTDSEIEVQVFVPENLVDRLDVDTEHAVTFPSSQGRVASGRLTRIGEQATRGAAFPVMLTLEPPPRAIRPGMTAEVQFQLNREDEAQTDLVIPASAFIPGPSDDVFVFVVDEETHTLERREIVVSRIYRDVAQVRSGLSEGEIIATRGLSFLRPKQEVVLIGTGRRRYDPPVLVDVEAGRGVP
ncbi:MAG: efflux RND transporter periplasmic adaptor subunit [Myxococcota bacterium]